MRLTVRAGCKVNLHLAITGVRENGYHELETLFYPVPEPHDTLEFAWAEDAHVPGPDGRQGSDVAPGFRLWCSLPELETSSNIVAKAYEAFSARTGFRPDLAVFLTKGVPHGAGLGGGSADAAAMLAFLNGQAGDKALDGQALSDVAVKLGADVPFFLMNRPAWATGIGEELTATDADLSGMTLLVAMPRERVNTAWAYRAWDASFFAAKQEGRDMLLTRSCPASMRPFCVSGAFIANAFEGVVFKEYPAIRWLKERLLALGASAAGMSGSGSAVFAIFKDSAKADAAATALGPSAAFLSALS